MTIFIEPGHEDWPDQVRELLTKGDAVVKPAISTGHHRD